MDRLLEKGKTKKKRHKRGLEIDYGFSNGQISLYCPWQVKELSHDEFEDLVDIYVVS